MTSGMFGGGVIFVVAALLWVAVLVPSWMRRREFRAAEQNALRLQRTLRVLAETAEVPTEVRVEATAREALAHERLLRTAQREQEAERKAKLAEARAAQLRAEMRAQQMKRTQASLVRKAKLRRPWVRRVRSITSMVLLLSLLAVPVGLGLLLANFGPSVLIAGAATAIAALGMLVLIAPGRAKHIDIPAEHLSTVAAQASAAPAPAQPATETTEDLAAAAHAAAQAAAAARIERARVMARARAAHSPGQQLRNQPDSILLQVAREPAGSERPRAADPLAPQSGEAVSQQREAAVRSEPVQAAGTGVARERRSSSAERLRKMGVVGDTSEGMLDLDSALRNRRRAG